MIHPSVSSEIQRPPESASSSSFYSRLHPTRRLVYYRDLSFPTPKEPSHPLNLNPFNTMWKNVSKPTVRVPTHILISFEGNTLECATRIPGSLTAWDITDYYEETQGTPLELWNGNVKLESDRKIGRMKNLILKRLNPTTPSKEEGEAPPHHQPCSPGSRS
ncbi:hypothetical protein GBAR_LOCUS27444 [Geodia barretti]|uniref:Uncharacterized protein n=1 Tax=Geodia barretti TaxID=519541 RepID=A0AA35TLF7_GEOBA|nr:hypothetical protein GBAR_LOCUS27444 [Geodia barretti]